MPLLRTEGGEEETQVCLVATEDGSPSSAEAMVLPFPPDEALVVYVTRSLDTSNTMDSAQGGVVVKPAHRVGEEAMGGTMRRRGV